MNLVKPKITKGGEKKKRGEVQRTEIESAAAARC